MPSGHDILVGGVVSSGFLLLIAAAELWRRIGDPPVEWTRKLVHVGGGLICLVLPLVITSHWVVLTMALGMAALFVATRALGWLPSVHGVQRAGHGTVFYPLVVYLLFVLSHGQPWRYFICILVLAVSDGMAALVGGRYGRIRYEVEDEWKSLEGSVVFLIVTFVAVQVPLVVWPDPQNLLPSAANCVLAALLVAMLVTAFEAISLGGSDNLWVPIGTYFVLGRVLRLELLDIALLNVSLVAICVAVGMTAWKTQAFNVGGTLAFILFAFASWALGSFHWALPLFIGYAAYLGSLYVGRESLTVKVLPVVRALLPPFLVLMAANVAWHYDRADVYRFLFGPYLAGCIVVLMQSVWNQLRRDYEPPFWMRQVGAAALTVLLWLLLAAPVWLLQSQVSWVSFVCVGISCLLAGNLHDALVIGQPPQDVTRRWIIARVAVTCTAMLIVAAFQLSGIAASWQPW